MAVEWLLPRALVRSGIDIHLWQRALASTPGVLCVRPVVDDAGASRKSKVAAEVVARGGGHLSPIELYVFVGSSKRRE